MKILLFGGTTEGRVLAERLSAMGAEVTVSVATPLGAEELAGVGAIEIRVGRRDAEEIAAWLPAFQLCVDATHPYATEATANIARACRQMGTPLRRLLRAPSGADGAVRVDDAAKAAAFLEGTAGNVLLAIGAKQLAAFSVLEPSRLYARVLPTHEGINACERLGLPHRNILALRGPFTQKMNEAMLEQYQIAWLVTKDGGAEGGMEEKLRAARNENVQVILICRPEERGESMEAICAEIEEVMR